LLTTPNQFEKDPGHAAMPNSPSLIGSLAKYTRQSPIRFVPQVEIPRDLRALNVDAVFPLNMLDV